MTTALVCLAFAGVYVGLCALIRYLEPVGGFRPRGGYQPKDSGRPPAQHPPSGASAVSAVTPCCRCRCHR